MSGCTIYAVIALIVGAIAGVALMCMLSVSDSENDE